MSVLIAWNAGVHFPDFMSGFAEWARDKEEQARVITTYLTRFTSVGRLLVGLLVIGVVPAVAEELVFRGVVQRNLVRWTFSPHVGVWLGAAIFSAPFTSSFLGLCRALCWGWCWGICTSGAAIFW